MDVGHDLGGLAVLPVLAGLASGTNPALSLGWFASSQSLPLPPLHHRPRNQGSQLAGQSILYQTETDIIDHYSIEFPATHYLVVSDGKYLVIIRSKLKVV